MLLSAGCASQPRTPRRCHNLVQNANLEKQGAGWRLPPFAKIEEAAGGPGGEAVRSIVVESAADGAIAQLIPRPADLSGFGVIAVGYARVELPQAMNPTDEDVTAQLWQGSVNLVDGYTRNGRDFVSPYARIQFSGREAASGQWKRFVTRAVPAAGARFLYPHFAFWAARLNDGVKLHLAGLALVEAPADDKGEPESWAECPSLLAPAPVIESPTQRQWDESQAPDGTFDGFEMTVRRIAHGSEAPILSRDREGAVVEHKARDHTGEPASRELLLAGRYKQGRWPADRFLISVTEDGTDPRLSPTSRIVTVLAQRSVARFEAVVRVKAAAGPLRIAVAGAAQVKDGLRAQTALLPPEWQQTGR